MKNALILKEKSSSELIEIIHVLSQENAQLLEIIRLYKHRQFGRKTEAKLEGQMGIFDEAAMPNEPEVIQAADEQIHVSSHNRKKSPGRKPLPEDLPREQRVYDLPEAEKICSCGEALTHITNETCEQLEIIPAKIYVVQHVRKKYACKGCEETIKTAEYPAQPIPRSIAGPGLLSHVIVSKFEDHLPLHRQENILRRIGVDIPRATLSLWVLRAAALLAPLKAMLKTLILGYDIAYADETTVQVIKEKRKSIDNKKFMWLFSGGSPDKFCFYYQYHPSREHAVAINFFKDFVGYLHCDGYGAYDALSARSESLTLVGCLYHARRKFVEVTKIAPSKKEGVAHQVLNYIKKLAIIEDEIIELQPFERQKVREEKARPVLESLHEYLLQVKAFPKSTLGQAISYTLNQWPKLMNYLKDGRLDISNNLSERAIKPFAIGRKGWLFANSVEGAEAAATLFSFVETCKYHEIEPYSWFRYVFQKLPLCKTDEERTALLPFNIDRSLLVDCGTPPKFLSSSLL